MHPRIWIASDTPVEWAPNAYLSRRESELGTCGLRAHHYWNDDDVTAAKSGWWSVEAVPHCDFVRYPSREMDPVHEIYRTVGA